MKKVMNILIGILVCAAVAALLVFAVLSRQVHKNSPDTVGNTAGNLMNGGLFVQDGDRVFFSNGYDNGTLYVMNSDETDIRKLGDPVVSSLNAGDSYIFYYQSQSAASASFASMFKTSGIYRADKKFKKSVCIKRVNSPGFLVAGNTLFFMENPNSSGTVLNRIDIDKKNEEAVSDSLILPYAIKDSKLYYGGLVDNHFLYSMDSDDGSTRVVYEGNLYGPQIDGDYVYFMDISQNYALCRFGLYTREVEKLTSDRIDTFNVTANYIYYQKNDPVSPALMRIRKDGSGAETVASGIYDRINATDSYVYFYSFGQSAPMFHTPENGAVNVSTFSAAAAAAAVQ